MDTPKDTPKDTPAPDPTPFMRHYVRKWNDDGTPGPWREVVDFTNATISFPNGMPGQSYPPEWVPMAPGVKQITCKLDGYLEKM